MKIGKPQRIHRVEPVQDPVPPAEQPREEPVPAREPPVPVPAP